MSLFQGALQTYNDALNIMHLAMLMPGIDPEVRAKCVERLEGRRDNMRHRMRFIKELLPEEEEITYRHPKPWPYENKD